MDKNMDMPKKAVNENSFEAYFNRLDKAISINIELQDSIRNKVDKFNGSKPRDITNEKENSPENTILGTLHWFARKLEINNAMLQSISNDLNEII